MKLPKVKPEWRTADVVGLCMSMREAQDWSAMPILADALQDAGCPDDSDLLARLRRGYTTFAVSAGLVGCVMSAETEQAVENLALVWKMGGPNYTALVNAAAGYHDENSDPTDSNYYYTEQEDEYLHFNGTDAHGEIPANLWELIQLATGKVTPDAGRPKHFSCSC